MSDYGSVAGVASLTRKYTNNGAFDATSRPAASAVEDFLKWVSGQLNLHMATAGFQTPVTEAISSEVKDMMDGMANTAAADLVQFSNSAGRFITDEKLRGRAPQVIISKELLEWIQLNSSGFALLGVPWLETPTDGIGAKVSSASGQDVNAIFKRDDFGNPGWDDL